MLRGARQCEGSSSQQGYGCLGWDCGTRVSKEGGGLSSSPPLPRIGGDTQSKKSPGCPKHGICYSPACELLRCAMPASGTRADTRDGPRGKAGAREGGESRGHPGKRHLAAAGVRRLAGKCLHSPRA